MKIRRSNQASNTHSANHGVVDVDAPSTKYRHSAASHTDNVGDGFSAFVDAITAGSQAARGASPGPDPKVTTAFALGWQVAELYRAKDWRPEPSVESHRLPEDLPGLGELSRVQRAALSLDQIDVAVARLTSEIKEVDLEPPTTKEARVALRAGVGEPFCRQLYDLHVQLLTVLTAADYKLGKAYGLGRALADACRKPRDLESLLSELDPRRIAILQAWIADLTSALPAHAGHSVNGSIKRWTDWVAAQRGEGPERKRSFGARLRSRLYGDESASEQMAAEERLSALRLLRRQGERWRAVLSGEKAAVDLLEIGDYVSAAFGLLKRFASLSLRFALPFLPLLLAAAALFGVGIWLALTQSSSHIAAGIVGLLASAGLTWKGVGGTLGKAVARTERPLWDAELDAAITTAITLLPGSKRVEGYTPPPLADEALHEDYVSEPQPGMADDSVSRVGAESELAQQPEASEPETPQAETPEPQTPQPEPTQPV